jgi:hypothetical protein
VVGHCYDFDRSLTACRDDGFVVSLFVPELGLLIVSAQIRVRIDLESTPVEARAVRQLQGRFQAR